ncbi:MAG: serine/threonine protein phosphatase, partial [Deltaproteobacteria bacterium]
MPSIRRWTFAVIADSHFHPPGTPAQAAYASDAGFNARNAAAVELLRRARPELVVHLGDVPHPVPGLADHDRALAVAADTYAALDAPLLVVPGNHDVGDKPHPWAPAPSVSEDKHAVFSAHWGPPWWSREHRGVVLVGVDTPVLNSGLPLEARQWTWLEQTLVAADGKPVLAFLHYPPFLLSPDEAEHYDNLAEPARSRLLRLFARHGVRAVFCGHVHHPFWHVHDGAQWVLMPATSFVRPGFAELARVGPGDEYGRNEAWRLGFCLVHVGEGPAGLDLDLEWVWTRGVHRAPALHATLAPGAPRPRCPLGVTLRHQWDAVLDIPADNLDPFRRKRARNDLALLAAWTAGIRLLRLPFEDLRRPATRRRLQDLSTHGFRAVLFTAEPLSDADRRLVQDHRDLVAAVEQVLPRAHLDRPLPPLGVPRLRAPFRRDRATDGRYF